MADQDQKMANGQGVVNGHGTVNGQDMVNGQRVDGQTGSDWEGIDQTSQDPEEARVMFCALDSFL